MTDSPDNTALKARLTRYERLARLWLFWERYAPVFLLAALALSVFLVGVFAGVWERLGDPWRGFGLLATLYILVVATYRAQKKPLPSRSESRRRVESDSDQKHRPLDVLDDKPAIGSEVWDTHYSRALDQAELLDSPKLRPSVAPHDRYYLRFVMPSLLVLAMMVGAGANMERLRRAITPEWQAGINPNDVTFEAWIDPPEYTGRPPIYFKGQDIDEIPAGSEWVARMNGAKSAPRPQLRLDGKTRYLRVNQLGRESFEARAIIDSPGKALWAVGTKRKIWDLNVVADTPPMVTIDETPEADKQDRLVVTYSFHDDYGVTALQLEMAEILSGDNAPFENASRVSMPLSSGSLPMAESVEGKLDLTRHPLAGKKVVARLIATDGAGQSAVSDNTYFTVPDKIFVEPLAKAIIEQRGLILNAVNKEYGPEPRNPYQPGVIYNTYEPIQRLDRAPESVERAALLIEAVTDRPEGLFQDPTVYLGLRNVRARLRYARDAETLRPIPDEMWSIALRAEFGVLGSALEEMREAEQALRDGMARRAPQREIDTLFDRYNNAVEAYTEELRRKALEEGNFAEESGGGGGGGLESTDEIEELLKAIEEANRAGDVEGARRALARLAEVLENMQIQLSRGGGGSGDGMQGEMSEEMKKNLEELADLLGEQRELQDETEEAQRQAENQQGDGQAQGQGQEGEEALSPGELAQRQEQLEELLGRLGEEAGNAAQMQAGNQGEAAGGEPGETGEGAQAGEEQGEGQAGGGEEEGEGRGSGGTKSTQEQLARAQGSMQGAAEALARGDLNAATEAQAEAIQALREAGEAMASEGLAQGDSGDATDPLGRENGGDNSDNAEADIDQRDNATRSRELMEELRRRAAEQERAKEERDYLERLLKRF